jgi:F-type H+-transporting ATPase subunit delta
MKIDRQSRQIAKKYFLACRNDDGSLNETGVREIVQLLVDQKPRNYLPILTHLYRLIELTLEENTVRVESATPLPDKGASVFSNLEKRYGKAARTSYQENPALLGGLRVRRGNDIWDGSLLCRLNRLEQAFS